jgi:hypothetical protein
VEAARSATSSESVAKHAQPEKIQKQQDKTCKMTRIDQCTLGWTAPMDAVPEFNSAQPGKMKMKAGLYPSGQHKANGMMGDYQLLVCIVLSLKHGDMLMPCAQQQGETYVQLLLFSSSSPTSKRGIKSALSFQVRHMINFTATQRSQVRMGWPMADEGRGQQQGLCHTIPAHTWYSHRCFVVNNHPQPTTTMDGLNLNAAEQTTSNMHAMTTTVTQSKEPKRRQQHAHKSCPAAALLQCTPMYWSAYKHKSCLTAR